MGSLVPHDEGPRDYQENSILSLSTSGGEKPFRTLYGAIPYHIPSYIAKRVGSNNSIWRHYSTSVAYYTILIKTIDVCMYAYMYVCMHVDGRASSFGRRDVAVRVVETRAKYRVGPPLCTA